MPVGSDILVPRVLLPSEQTAPLPSANPEIRQSESIESALGYTFQLKRGTHQWEPFELGQGVFARVFLGEQLIDGHSAAKVAIKVLHAHATLADERLFAREIEHLRYLSDTSSVSVAKILDVLKLDPLVLCACGKLYRPRCPRCAQDTLRRAVPTAGQRHPALFCVQCATRPESERFFLPADRVKDRIDELIRGRSRACTCEHGDVPGTLINFVPRDAIVLERIELPLAEFASARRQYLHRLFTAKGLSIGTPHRGVTVSSVGERVSSWFAGKNDPARIIAIAHKVLLLEKVRIVVQLAETLAWLHGQKEVVHKDLALDNVMVRVAPISANDEAWRGELRPTVTASDLLNDLASCHSFRAVLIDFGLSDTSIPTRAWYDDAAATGQSKEPFLSPEAKDRKVQINLTQRLIFSPAEKTFEIPPELQGMLREGDTIVDRQDPDHRFEFRVEQVQGTRATYSYSYEAPERRDFRQIVLEQPLLEPHDVFALGALFYYLLTERFVVSRGNGELRSLDQDLRGLLRELESHGTPVEKGTVQREGLYREVRSAIYAPAWHDDLMLIILRAMTRGLPHSYARNRIHRGPEPAQQFLLEIKRLHNDIQRDIVSSW